MEELPATPPTTSPTSSPSHTTTPTNRLASSPASPLTTTHHHHHHHLDPKTKWSKIEGSEAAARLSLIRTTQQLGSSNMPTTDLATTTILVDEQGRMRDELGFLLTNEDNATSTLHDGSTPPSSTMNDSEANHSPGSVITLDGEDDHHQHAPRSRFTLDATGIRSPRNITRDLESKRTQAALQLKDAQRVAWDEFRDLIGGPVQILTRTELQRWRKNVTGSNNNSSSSDQVQDATPPRVGGVASLASSGHDRDSTFEDTPPPSVTNTPSPNSSPRNSNVPMLDDKKRNKNGKNPRKRAFVERGVSGLLGLAQKGAAVFGITETPSMPTVGGPTARRASIRLQQSKISQRLQPTKARQKILTRLIRQHGIPTELRANVWIACSGALEKRANASEQYETIIERIEGIDGEAYKTLAAWPQIERDLRRTFPTNYTYETEEGISSLRRVLLAYSVRNETVGYCQSMNFVVGVLLLHMNEPNAFWVLAAIVEDLLPGYFSPDLFGVHIDHRVLSSMIRDRFPKVTSHLASLELPLGNFTYQWLMCLFVNALPLGTVLRVWDSFLHEGPKVLFRVALIIIKQLSGDIMQATSIEDANLVLTNFTRDRERFAGNRVMKLAFDPLFFGSFSTSQLADLRRAHTEQLNKEMIVAKDAEAAHIAARRIQPPPTLPPQPQLQVQIPEQPLTPPSMSVSPRTPPLLNVPVVVGMAVTSDYTPTPRSSKLSTGMASTNEGNTPVMSTEFSRERTLSGGGGGTSGRGETFSPDRLTSDLFSWGFVTSAPPLLNKKSRSSSFSDVDLRASTRSPILVNAMEFASTTLLPPPPPLVAKQMRSHSVHGDTPSSDPEHKNRTDELPTPPQLVAATSLPPLPPTAAVGHGDDSLMEKNDNHTVFSSKSSSRRDELVATGIKDNDDDDDDEQTIWESEVESDEELETAKQQPNSVGLRVVAHDAMSESNDTMRTDEVDVVHKNAIPQQHVVSDTPSSNVRGGGGGDGSVSEITLHDGGDGGEQKGGGNDDDDEIITVPTVDLPAEFASRHRSLSFVMSARQTGTSSAVVASSTLPGIPEDDDMMDIHQILQTMLPKPSLHDDVKKRTTRASEDSDIPIERRTSEVGSNDMTISQSLKSIDDSPYVAGDGRSSVLDPPTPITQVRKTHPKKTLFSLLTCTCSSST